MRPSVIPRLVPLSQTSPNQFVLELFHGPTLAFKDVAMQLISRLMDHVLAQRAQRTTIVVATSATPEAPRFDAFAGLDNVDLIVLFPHGPHLRRAASDDDDDGRGQRPCVGHRRQFDDCQAIVKGMFNHHRFRDSVSLSGVNSIQLGADRSPGGVLFHIPRWRWARRSGR